MKLHLQTCWLLFNLDCGKLCLHPSDAAPLHPLQFLKPTVAPPVKQFALPSSNQSFREKSQMMLKMFYPCRFSELPSFIWWMNGLFAHIAVVWSALIVGDGSGEISVPVWILPLERCVCDEPEWRQTLLPPSHPGPGEKWQLHQIWSAAATGPLLPQIPSHGQFRCRTRATSD